MKFNTDKFECLWYGKNHHLKDSTFYYAQDGRKIDEKDSVSDLGITMSTSADFKAHIGKFRVTASNLCSWIVRTFKTRAKKPMLTLWKSLVLPHLDYCCQVWALERKGEIEISSKSSKIFKSSS